MNNKQVIKLDSPGVSKALSKRILEDIDEYCVTTYDGGHRWHLGASLIGHECSRYLWLLFRWCFREKTTGRQQRLFNRGHREEDRFIEWLEGIGVKTSNENYEGLYYNSTKDCYDILKPCEELQLNCDLITQNDPNYEKNIARAKADGLTFPQWRISACHGHFGGSLDGFAYLPERYNINEPVLLEFKTNGTGRGFEQLKKDGMQIAKPQHFSQTSTYGAVGINGMKFNHCIYLNINKNDDDLHVEVVKLDHKLGEHNLAKAEKIIFFKEPPGRLAENPTFFKCKYCPANAVCHKQTACEKNCRSCKFANPVENGEWFCEVYKGVIPREFVPKACKEYQSIY